jgi:hypothetical protein
MRKFLLYVLGAAILFAVSASVSLWMQHKNGRGTKDYADGGKAGDGGPADGDARVLPRAPVTPGKRDGVEMSLPTKNTAGRDDDARRQARLELIGDDLRNERAKLEELRKQIQDELLVVARKVPELDTAREVAKHPGPAAREDADARGRPPYATASSSGAEVRVRREPAGDDGSNLDQVAAYCESITPAKAARLLAQLAERGNPDTAVKVLALIREPARDLVLAELATLGPALATQVRATPRASAAPSAPPGLPTPVQPPRIVPPPQPAPIR